jgi:hypothetical protein
MIKIYNEKFFIVDIISDAYNTKDSLEISKYCKDIFNIDLEVFEIVLYLFGEENVSRNKNSLMLKDIFNE